MPDDSSRQAVKVLLVTHYYPAHRGGIEIIAREIAARLAADHDFDITWAASDVDEPFNTERIRAVPMRTWNLTERALGVPYPLWGPLSLRRLWRLVSQADVIHLHDCLYMGCVAASLFARMRQKPVLVTQHIGLVPYRSRVLRSLMEIGNRMCGQIVLGTADRVIYYSVVVRDYFLHRVRHRSNVELVPNGVDSRLYTAISQENREQLRSQLNIGPAQFACLFVGRFVEKKGIRLLKMMAQQMPEVLWLIAGHGPLNPDAPELPNVRIYRRRSGESLAELYRAADLLVLPSVGEGFPLVVAESLACGTPTIVSTETFAAATDEMRPLLFHEPVTASDDEETAMRWVRSIHSLLADRPELRRRGAHAAAIAATSWSWDFCAARYAKIVREIAAGPTAGK